MRDNLHFHINAIFQLSSDVVIEKFEEGALLLYSDKYYLMELNNTAYRILSLIDGKKKICEIAKIIAKDYQIAENLALNDVIELYSKLFNRKIIEIVNSDSKAKQLNSIYMKNPDVIVHEENSEGGTLFNPKNNQMKILNATGLFIWEKFDRKRSIKEIIDIVHQAFDEASRDEVAKDVQEFIKEMKKGDFIRIADSSVGENIK